MSHRLFVASLLGSVGLLSAFAAEAGTASIESVQVTATRIPEPVGDVPADVTIISGDEMRARGTHDLGSAMALVPGVQAPPGGDAGPSSAVPSFWGLHEFDAFLLVVDGVPWGGAFNPAIPSLNLNDVQRIEVLKGAAPAVYGATSFVGVVHVVHFPAGESSNEITVAGGNFDSWRGTVATALPASGNYQHSIAIDSESLGFADDREQVRDAHVLYRGAATLGRGELRFDVDYTRIDDVPPSPVIRDGEHLTRLTPLDANHNPNNAEIVEDRYHATLGYSLATGWGQWDTAFSFAHSTTHDARGFLRPDLIDDRSNNADSQDQHRDIDDAYLDSHIRHRIADDTDLVFGADLLYGRGSQRSQNGEYYTPFSGHPVPQSIGSIHVDETNTIDDRRWFAGQYAELDWRPTSRWDIVAGLRLNETDEYKASAHLDGFDPAEDEHDVANDHQVRLSGTIGASYQIWNDGQDEAVFYADYRNAFKPAAIDFGPDNTPDILNPETAESYEIGIKGALGQGRFTYQLEAFLLNFSNLVVATTDAEGDPVLRNAGGERLEGVEAEARYLLAPDLTLAGTLAFHNARFTDFILDEDGTPIDVSGKQLTLAPRILAAVGLLYTPAEGPHAAVVTNFVGRSYLDEENEAPTGSYVTLGATAGYRWGRFDLTLSGTNITNQRPPVTQSEFGASSYYLLPARTVFLRLGVAL